MKKNRITQLWIASSIILLSLVPLTNGNGINPGDNEAGVTDTDGITSFHKVQVLFTPFTSYMRKDTIPTIGKRSQSPNSLDYEPTSHLLPDHQAFRQPNECNVVFEGTDPRSGSRKKELGYETLFTYTAPHVKPYTPGIDLLEARFKLIRFNGGYTYASVEFQWNANDPQSSYGRLKSKSAIRIYLSDKKSVTLYNDQESNWHYNEEAGYFQLQALFLLHPRQIKLLKKETVSKAAVFWERGFEEYPVYALTLFQDQLTCLE